VLGYEIALEGVRQAIGFYAQRIAEAEAAGDPAVIDELREQQARWAARGRDLTPLDARAIARVRDDADNLLSVPDEDDDETDPGGTDRG
jgi:hypothetical protein